jgi:hypothetical protein
MVQLSARTQPIYDNTRTSDGHWQDPPAAAELLRHEQTRDLTPHEAVGWLADYEALFALARERTGYLDLATLPAYRLLQADAARLMRSVGPIADITQLRYRHRQRDAALNRGDAARMRRLEFPEQDPLAGRIQTNVEPGQAPRAPSHRTRAVPRAGRNGCPRMSP